jgi:hypothetical protein
MGRRGVLQDDSPSELGMQPRHTRRWRVICTVYLCQHAWLVALLQGHPLSCCLAQCPPLEIRGGTFHIQLSPCLPVFSFPPHPPLHQPPAAAAPQLSLVEEGAAEVRSVAAGADFIPGPMKRKAVMGGPKRGPGGGAAEPYVLYTN